MTDKQFQQLFAAQLAQIALLQAIEANVSAMAHKTPPWTMPKGCRTFGVTGHVAVMCSGEVSPNSSP